MKGRKNEIKSKMVVTGPIEAFKDTNSMKNFLVHHVRENPNMYISKTINTDKKSNITLHNAGFDLLKELKIIDKTSSIMPDDILKIFKDKLLVDLYVEIEHKFDEWLSNYYLTENNFFAFVKWIDSVLSIIPTNKTDYLIADGFMSQYSHFHAFISQLDEVSSSEVRDKFPIIYTSYIEYKLNNKPIFSNISDAKPMILKWYSKIEKLQNFGEIDFYSPGSRQDILNNPDIASHEHWQTHVDDKYQESINSTELILSRWIINIVYEKMILMNFSILKKYVMNYILTMEHHPEYLGGMNE